MVPLLLLALAAAWLRAPSQVRTAVPAPASGASLGGAVAVAGDAAPAPAARWRSHRGQATLRELAASRGGVNRGEDDPRDAQELPAAAGPAGPEGGSGQHLVTPSTPGTHGIQGSAGASSADATPPPASPPSSLPARAAPEVQPPASPPPPEAAPEIKPQASPPPPGEAAGEAAPSPLSRPGPVAPLQSEESAQRPRTELRRPAGLSGRWVIQNVVRSTTYSPYSQLRLTYRVALRQVGERVFGDGEKWEENGRPLPRTRRTPIHLAGQVVGREVRARFTERGAWRDSEGSFRWHLSPGGDRFAGTFASDAANARGSSAAARLANDSPPHALARTAHDPSPHPVARVHAFMRHLVQSVRTRLQGAAHPSP